MDTLLTVGLVGAVMAAVTAMHLHLTAPPPEAALDRPTNDIDAEFFRIIDREQLRRPSSRTRRMRNSRLEQSVYQRHR